MDFEPFHSDEDEELASIMPEKKKKDGDKWKKPKGGPLFRNEKKMAYNDIHASPGIKGKHSVHGVVGPADYIYDQSNSPTTEQLRTSQVMSQPSAVPSSNASARTAMMPQPASSSVPQKQVSRPDISQQSVPVIQKQNVQPDISQQQQQQKHFTRLNSSPGAVSFTPNFPPISAMPVKIDRDRPHFSPAALPDVAQGPIPFKHTPQTNNQNKQTLLSQAMSATQFQQPSAAQQPPIQVTAANHTYLRSQTFDSTVCASSKPIPIPSNASNPDFSSNYENVGDRSINSSQEYVEPPLPETMNVFSQGSTSSPPISPFGSEVVAEGAWPVLDNKQNAPQDYVDSAEWANFHPSLSLHNPYEGDNIENRRKSHGTDSLSESIPESMSSVDSELEDSVWKINNEQREYYTKQFKKIQPNVDEVIKGPQARDFFLKSNLPNETLSMIWQLSDMDKDAALNLNEFCIAMHLVVAVKHGVDLPTILPYTLIQPCSEELLVPLSEEVQPVIEESDDEIKNSSISDEASLPSSADVSLSNLVEHIRRSSLQDVLNVHDRGRSASFGADGTPLSPVFDRTNGGLNFNTPMKEISSNQAAIARPRASAQKNVNLMDSAPWQLLPPPSTKGKPPVKKTLNMDDESAFMSNESIEHRNSFSSSEQLTRGRNEFGSVQECDDKSNSNNIEKTNGLSKEKSRSIDSLRQDMNEDYTSFEMRRLSRDSRPRSYSGEGSQFNGLSSKRISKDIEIPPIPPPRDEGPLRINSLDSDGVTDSVPTTYSGSQEIHPTTSVPNVDASSSIVKGSNHDINKSPKEIPSSSIMVSSSHTSQLSREITTDSVRHVVRFSDKLDVLDDEVSKSIDKKVTRNELQARIRMLKSTNATLNNLLTQLHMEWKSASEERIALDILLEKEKQDLS